MNRIWELICAAIFGAGLATALFLANRPAANQPPPSAPISMGIGQDTVNSDGTVVENGIDDQVAKDLWYFCTPSGWQEFQTSVPVHIWQIPTAPGLSSLDQGRLVLGPFSPADTFKVPWAVYPKAGCRR